MMKRCIVLLISMYVASCQPNDKKEYKIIEDNYKPALSEEVLYSQLNTISAIADSNKRSDSITHFFAKWHASIPPNNEDFIRQNDTLAAIYAVHKAIFQPFKLHELGTDWEPRNILDTTTKYLAIQNSLCYAIIDTISGINSNTIKRQDTLSNFRPPLDIEHSEILYLTKEYETALQNFLGVDSIYAKRFYISNAVQSVERSEQQQMIRGFIPIIHSSSLGLWNLPANPYIQSITLNKALDKAIVDFIVGYQGGIALMHKVNGKWIIKDSKSTWIE